MTNPLINNGYLGHGLVRKQGPAFGVQAPITQTAPQTPDIHETTLFQSPQFSGPHMHRHLGREQDHPVGLRHRKGSQDPLHGEEDKLYDELKDLTDKANQGMCTKQDMDRLREVHGQLSAIQHQRRSSAQAILGRSVDNAVAQNAAAQPVREAQPTEPMPDSDATADDTPEPSHMMPRQPSSLGWQDTMSDQRQLDQAVTEPPETSAPWNVPNTGGYSHDRSETAHAVPLW